MKLVDFGRQAPAARQAWELTNEEIASIGHEAAAPAPPLTAAEQALEDVKRLGVLVEFDRHTMIEREYEFAWDCAVDKIVASARQSDSYRNTALSGLKANGLLGDEYEIVLEELEIEHENPAPSHPGQKINAQNVPTPPQPKKDSGLDR